MILSYYVNTVNGGLAQSAIISFGHTTGVLEAADSARGADEAPLELLSCTHKQA